MRFKRTVCGGVLAGALAAVPAAAQMVGGSLRGTVTDPSGQPISGAHVLVRHTGTGDARELVTQLDGRYHAPLLPPGEYESKASLPGFQTVDRRGIRLAVGQDALVNVTLEVGKVTEELVVNADVSRVNLTSGAVWEVHPTTAWNYGLVLDPRDASAAVEVREKPVGDNPFSPRGAPVEISVKGRRVREWMLVEGSAGPLPQSPVASPEPDETLTLVPYGSAKLRVTAFPRIEPR